MPDVYSYLVLFSVVGLMDAALILLLLPNQGSIFYVQLLALLFLSLLFLLLGCRYLYLRHHQKLRKEFHKALKKLESFDIDRPSPVDFEVSSFAPLNEMQQYVHELVNRIQNHYSTNKQFTEKATAELQSPLNRIKENIRKLLKSPQMRQGEKILLEDTLESTLRLTRLNDNLILLSSIDYGIFNDLQPVNINSLLDEVLEKQDDTIKTKQIEIIKDYQRLIRVRLSKQLANLLIVHLLHNAIYHNYHQGFIQISTWENTLEISNSGEVPPSPSQQLFERFKRSPQNPDGLGLGLTIVQRICQYYRFDVDYFYLGDTHTLRLSFH